MLPKFPVIGYKNSNEKVLSRDLQLQEPHGNAAATTVFFELSGEFTIIPAEIDVTGSNCLLACQRHFERQGGYDGRNH